MGTPNLKTQTNLKGEATRLMYTFQSHTGNFNRRNFFEEKHVGAV